MPIANRLSKPQQRLHEEVMEYEVEWLPDDCCFRLQVLRYRDHWRMVCPRWFLIAELYGRPLGHGKFVLHGIFWRQVRQLTTVERCRMTQSSTGIAAFFAWLKEQETVDSKLLLAIPELRPYQIQGAHRLVKGNLLLGDDMGTGKTCQMLAALAAIEKQALVVVPNDSIAWEWQAQVEKFNLPFQSLVIDRSRREDPGTFDLYFVTYAKARRPDYLQHLLKLVEGRVLILDEGHRAGRVTSQQHHACYELSENAERIWVSSGTEVSGTPDDYYGVFRLVVPCHYGPHLLVGPELWVKYFKAKGTKAWAEARLKEDLHTVRRGFGLRRTKAEVCKELPPITEIDYALPMHPIQVAQYMDMKRDLQTKVQSLYGEQELTENQFIVAYLRLMQLAAHPMLLGETRVNLTPKTERLLELVEDAGDQSVLVWSNWPDVIEWLAGHIRDKGIDCLAVHGGTSQAQRTAARDAFMERRVRCLVANPGVWGEGVNLQVASIMIDHDYHPSLSRWKQSRARAHRIGQTLPVTSYRLYHSGSIERQILDWLQEKGRLSAIITGG